MTVKEIIIQMERIAEKHGNDIPVVLCSDSGIEEIEKIDFAKRGDWYNTVWTDMIILE